ncbi:MAG: hypothetical protein GWN01_17825 [Nitrosopumilaceae archaeon]|nr:hypothetical protein [Nitrosopumilaceae archaeon]NIX63282.1 hypothetical protein [Nitrosopumilaceae archaeon]
MGWDTILDVFDKQGRLLTTLEVRGTKMAAFTYDSEGFLYFVDNSGFAKVVKFKLKEQT